jgi:hypothetical protein
MEKRDVALAFRIPGRLKDQLQATARREGRSVSQVCELLLKYGAAIYEKRGAAMFEAVLVQEKNKK